MKEEMSWDSLTGQELLEEIGQREAIRREKGALCPSSVTTELRKLRALYKRSAFERGGDDCYRDSGKNSPFASVGGIERRGRMRTPGCVEMEGERYIKDYLAGYQAVARILYGEDWRTCKFGRTEELTVGRV